MLEVVEWKFFNSNLFTLDAEANKIFFVEEKKCKVEVEKRDKPLYCTFLTYQKEALSMSIMF
jgi:hypothetical protein